MDFFYLKLFQACNKINRYEYSKIFEIFQHQPKAVVKCIGKSKAYFKEQFMSKIKKDKLKDKTFKDPSMLIF